MTVVIIIAIGPLGITHLRAQGVSLASLPSGDFRPRLPTPPSLLSLADVDRYRQIFALQDKARWAEANRLIEDLDDRLLLGSVLAARYLSRDYVPSFRQGREWLARYSDQPEAGRVSERTVKDAAAATVASPAAADPARTGPAEGTVPGHPVEVRPDEASARFPRLARAPQEERRWKAAMAAWRGQRFLEAGRLFEQLAAVKDGNPWTRSAAAYWAARAHASQGRPEMARFWLGLAAETPRTFYGLLARRALGVDPDFNFAQPLDPGAIATLINVPGGRRALALLQVGRWDQARGELSLLTAHASPALASALLALGEAANLPDVELQTSALALAPDGRRLDNGLYPVPRWVPAQGYSVDRALLFSLMMQESFFTPDVRNRSGAMGLMQLMPETARTMVAHYRLPVSADNLLDPVTNVTVAQAYVDYLLQGDTIRGNLVMMAIAYNSGVGALARYQSTMAKTPDPLLFMETLPVVSRGFVQRLLTNLSIYRLRLGQAPAELDALAAGHWPIYVPSDPPSSDGFRSEGLRHAAN